jgi:hypothetical protein
VKPEGSQADLEVDSDYDTEEAEAQRLAIKLEEE